MHSPFIDNIWGADLADTQLISKSNKGIHFLLFVIFYYLLLFVICYKHGLFLWKIKKRITITNAFQNFLKGFNRKPNKIWVDKRSEFYNRSMKSFLQNNNIETYSTHNEGKSVVAERFIRTLKNKIFKYMILILKMCVLIN